MQQPRWFKQTLTAGIMMIPALTACEKSDRSFSILPEENQFAQSTEFTAVPRKIDILWMIDNSGSMATSQQAVIENFGRFIERFQTLKYDFHMGVATTDAWTAAFNPQVSSRRRLKDRNASQVSGVFVMDRQTPNLDQVFMINANQGINGNGDERPLQSIEQVLTFSANQDFRRQDAFLAIIILTDEDDFSSRTSSHLNNNYNATNLIPITEYKAFFDQTLGSQNYSLNTISILDQTCATSLQNSFQGRIVSKRINELVDLTGGSKASLCDDFGDSLQLISDTIIEENLTYIFRLAREPVPGTIRVVVNGLQIFEDPVNGWQYFPEDQTVRFAPAAIPAAGSQIAINYDPIAPKN